MAKHRKRRILARDSKGRIVSRKRAVSKRRKRSAKKNPVAVRRRRRRHAAKNPAAPKRRRRRAAKAASPVRRRRRRASKKSPARRSRRSRSAAAKLGARRRRRSVRGDTRKIKRLRRQVRRSRGGKFMKRARRTRLTALSTRRALRRGGKMSGRARKYLRDHGFSHVNGSYGGKVTAALKSLGGLVPEILVSLVGYGGSALLGDMLGKKIVEKMGAGYAEIAAPAASAAVGILGFVGLRVAGKPALSNAFLFGSVASVGLSVLANVHVAPALGSPAGTPQLSLGRSLGLPIGNALIPGMGLDLGLSAYLPRGQVNALNAYLPRQDLKQLNAYIPRSEAVAFNGVGDTTMAKHDMADPRKMNDVVNTIANATTARKGRRFPGA